MSSSPSPLAHIAELWRYPVKSMAGERVERLEILPDGIAHDRRFAFLSSGAPAGKPRLTSRERAALLRYSAHVSANGTQIRTPEGRSFAVDDPDLLIYLEAHLPQGNRITLEHEPDDPPYTDVRPIALASTQTFATIDRTFGRGIDPRRFRANLVLTFTDAASKALTSAAPDSFPEDALAGQMLRLGQALQFGQTCRLRLLERIPRCRVVTLDPDTAEPDPGLMKHLDRYHGGRLGIYAAVLTPGSIQVGDPVHISTT